MTQDYSFGRWVYQQRKAMDLTQSQLAERVACARVTVQKIESGRLRPSREIAERVAHQLGVAAHERAAFVQWARRGTPPAGPDPVNGGCEHGQQHAIERQASRGVASSCGCPPRTTLVLVVLNVAPGASAEA